MLIEFLKLAALLLSVLGITALETHFMKKRQFKVNTAVNLLAMSLVTALLFVFGGLTVWTLTGIAFALILLYASVQDISTHEADDSLWVMILLLCLTSIGRVSVVSMLIGGAAVFIPQFTIAMLSKTQAIGGADIKISTASALMLGVMGGLSGYLIGLVIAVVFQLIYNKVKHRTYKKAFALLPFLSVGLMIGYFI